MKWYHRTLSGVLAASMGLSLMGGIPSAVAADRATDPARTAAVAAGTTGTIQATIRMDYPITPDKMAQSGGTVTLYRGTAAIAEGSLSKDGAALTFTDGSTAVGRSPGGQRNNDCCILTCPFPVYRQKQERINIVCNLRPMAFGHIPVRYCLCPITLRD